MVLNCDRFTWLPCRPGTEREVRQKPWRCSRKPQRHTLRDAGWTPTTEILPKVSSVPSQRARSSMQSGKQQRVEDLHLDLMQTCISQAEDCSSGSVISWSCNFAEQAFEPDLVVSVVCMELHVHKQLPGSHYSHMDHWQIQHRLSCWN